MSPSQVLAEPDAVMARADTLIDEGRLVPARMLLRALDAMGIDVAVGHSLHGRLLMREGLLDEAEAEIDAAIAAAPSAITHRLCRARLRLLRDNAAGSAEDAAEALMLDRRCTQAKGTLGIALIETGQLTDAIACLREALHDDPTNAVWRKGLAEACERAGFIPEARALLAEGVRLSPGNVSLRVASVMAAIRQRDFQAAAHEADDACRDGIADAQIFGLLGHALSCAERQDEAAAAYREALHLAPDDSYVRHLVMTAGSEKAADRASSAYVETVFDGYAAGFEAHLVDLAYRVPGLIRSHLLTALGGRVCSGAILDLGCGTGLVAVALSDLPFGPFTGVDLSAGMLAQARAKGLYELLHQADITAFLQQAGQRWPIIVAADVFCYFGDLAEPFRHAFACLEPGGVLVCSLETAALPAEGGPSDGLGWELGARGRYRHGAAYVAQAAQAAGLRLHSLIPEILRQEAGTPVTGLVAVLTRETAHV